MSSVYDWFIIDAISPCLQYSHALISMSLNAKNTYGVILFAFLAINGANDPNSNLCFYIFLSRYHACESLYNIVKVARGGCLPHFEQIFDALARLATDPEASVRSGAEALDRLMKDIVSESPAFDLVAFMNMLRERIMVQNTAARQFLVGWVRNNKRETCYKIKNLAA